MPQTSDPAKKHHVVGHELLTAAATVDSDTGATILTVTGEAHLLTAPVSHRRLDEHFGANRAPITVDLSRVEFFRTNALAILIDAHQRASAEGRDFLPAAKTRIVRRPLEATKPDAMLSIHDDLHQALKAVHASATQRSRHRS